MKTKSEIMAESIRYYTEGRLPRSMEFAGVHFTSEHGNEMKAKFLLKIPSPEELPELDRKVFIEKIGTLFSDAFADNEFAREKMRALTEEIKKLTAKVEALSKELSNLYKFKSYYDLAFVLSHGKKHDIP